MRRRFRRHGGEHRRRTCATVSIVGNRKIAARLDEVPVLNSSNGRSREERLSVQAVDRVLRKYEVDFKMFGYSTEPLDGQKDQSA